MVYEQNRYYQRGVSADKEDVHSAIKNLDKGLFPMHFVRWYQIIYVMIKTTV